MRKFFTSVRNERNHRCSNDTKGHVTQCANSDQWAHVRSKDLGVRVRQWIDRNGEDRLEVHLTGGTDGARELGLLFTDDGPTKGHHHIDNARAMNWQRIAREARGQE